MTEVNHRVSKEASNKFFELGLKWFSKLEETKRNQGIRKPTAQFAHLRKKMYSKHVPPIKLDITYQHIESGEITHLEGLSATPTSKFPPSQYKKLLEVAYVEVKKITISFHSDNFKY